MPSSSRLSCDEKLDLIVSADGAMRWKDEDELEHAAEVGLIEASEVRAEAARVVKEWPFPTGWEDWQPDPARTGNPTRPGRSRSCPRDGRWSTTADPTRHLREQLATLYLPWPAHYVRGDDELRRWRLCAALAATIHNSLHDPVDQPDRAFIRDLAAQYYLDPQYVVDSPQEFDELLAEVGFERL